MAASPKYKLFRDGQYIGSMKDPADAARCVFSSIADDVRTGHAKTDSVWDQEWLDLDSFDTAAEAMLWREQENHQTRANSRARSVKPSD